MQNRWISIIQIIQTSKTWGTVLYLLSFLFMYLVIFDTDTYFNQAVGLEGTILIIAWADIIFENLHKTNQKIMIGAKI